MNYGMYISTSGLLASLYRQDVYANNLANLETIGFKADLPETRHRASVRTEDGLAFLPSDGMLERLGAGVQLIPNRVSFKEGSLRHSGNAFDVAIRGDGFFAVEGGPGERPRLTRDGRFSRDAEGRLIQSSTGAKVLDPSDQPITIPYNVGDVAIDSDGTMWSDDRIVGKIQFVSVPDKARLTKAGDNYYHMDAQNDAGRAPAEGEILQYALEESAVDSVRTMMQITSAARAVNANLGMVQYQDRLLDRAINGLGRVA